MARSNDGERNGVPDDEPPPRSSGDERAGDRLGELFDVLRSARRRRLLYYLQDLEGTETTLECAVRAINAFESSIDASEGAPRGQSIWVSLAHTHLPRLDAAGVLEYDHRSGDVRYEGDERFEPWLDRTRELEHGPD